MQTRDPEAQVPITINCWPSNSGGESFVNLEYECNTSLELQEVNIMIPLPNLKSAPRITSVSHLLDCKAEFALLRCWDLGRLREVSQNVEPELCMTYCVLIYNIGKVLSFCWHSGCQFILFFIETSSQCSIWSLQEIHERSQACHK